MYKDNAKICENVKWDISLEFESPGGWANGGLGASQVESPCCAHASGGAPFIQFEGPKAC